jgi:hypothetical protein
MLSSEPVNYTSILEPTGVGVTINNVFTDDLFGVVTTTTFTLPGILTVADEQTGVILTPDDVSWIDDTCDDFFVSTVPEPGASVLFAVGLSVVFVATRRFGVKRGR